MKGSEGLVYDIEVLELAHMVEPFGLTETPPNIIDHAFIGLNPSGVATADDSSHMSDVSA